MYIIFEGVDTCGKSTQIELLSKRLKDVIITKEPGGTDFGIKAREILLSNSLSSKRAELLLFLADRAEHYEKIIKPNIDKIILSDRGFLSGIGYALANNDFNFDYLIELNKFALEDTFPDLIVFFKIDMQTLKARTNSKELDSIEERGLDYLLKVQDKMIFSLKKLDIPYITIDASKDIESIYRKINNLILQESC